MTEGEGREVWFLNRCVLVVRPRQPFVDWVMSLDEEDTLHPEEVSGWTTAFLTPEFESEEESWAWIAENCAIIFEIMLSDWVLTPDQWPADRSWEAFQRWVAYERVEIAWDLVDEPLSSDPPIAEIEGPFLEA